MMVPEHLGGHRWECWVDRGALRFLHNLGRRSLIDIGCGPGDQVALARQMGFDAVGIDGDPRTSPGILHDFTTGPLARPPKAADVGWCVEFLEHVPERFLPNVAPVIRRCEWVVVTASPFESRRHYNVQGPDYWIRAFRSWGFWYSPWLYQRVLGHSTMRPFRGTVSYMQLSGMAFVRDDFVRDQEGFLWTVQRSRPW